MRSSFFGSKKSEETFELKIEKVFLILNGEFRMENVNNRGARAILSDRIRYNRFFL